MTNINTEKEGERIVSVIKHMKGSDIKNIKLKKEKGIKDTDNVKLVVKENSPRRLDYVKSQGRMSDLINSL